MYYVYVLHSESIDRYYIGCTADIERRLGQHNTLPQGFTKSGRPWKLVYAEVYESKTEALGREKRLKRMKSRRMIEALVGGQHSHDVS